HLAPYGSRELGCQDDVAVGADESAPQRFEIVDRIPAGHDDLRRGDGAAIGLDFDRPPSRANARDARLLEHLRAPGDGGPGEPERGLVGIDAGVAMRDEAEPVCTHPTNERRSFDRRNLEPGVAQRRILFLKLLNAVRRGAEMHGVANLEAALDAKAFQRGEVFVRSAARTLVDVPRVAHPMLFRKLVEERLRLMNDDTGSPAR